MQTEYTVLLLYIKSPKEKQNVDFFRLQIISKQYQTLCKQESKKHIKVSNISETLH